MELMKLDEAKEIIRKELQKDIVWLRNNEKNNDYFADKYRKEANAYHTVLQELDRLQKENDRLKNWKQYREIRETRRTIEAIEKARKEYYEKYPIKEE